jgi:hypothetical protein
MILCEGISPVPEIGNSEQGAAQPALLLSIVTWTPPDSAYRTPYATNSAVGRIQEMLNNAEWLWLMH